MEVGEITEGSDVLQIQNEYFTCLCNVDTEEEHKKREGATKGS